MKIYSYILIILLGILTAQCSKDEITDLETDLTDPDDYNSYWYYSYEAAQLIDGHTFGMEAEEFTPYTVVHLGDTLFIANTGNAGNSLMLFSQKENKLLKTLKTWNFNGKRLQFESSIEAIVPAGERLYVAERQSRIHVFSLPYLTYITCIGNGNWGGPVFQAQALAVNNGLIYARDKNGKVSIYKESEATPENYQKTKRYRQVAGNGTANNAFAPHYMQFVDEMKILLTDYEGKRIRVLDGALVNDDLENNSSIDMEDLTLSLDFKPKTLAVGKARWYATGDNNAINIYDKQSQKWTHRLNSVKGYAFAQPARIYAQNDSVLWVSDTHNTKRTLVKVAVHKGEIRE